MRNIFLIILRRFVYFPSGLVDKLRDINKRQYCTSHASARLTSMCRIVNHQGKPENISISKNCLICGQLTIFHHGGKISVGDNSFISEDTRIWSGHSIVIGSRVLISHNVHLLDYNSHSTSARRRHEEFMDVMAIGRPKTVEGISSAGIVIEDDVWIGFNSTILKGVTIGKGAIVGANSVITKDIPAYTIVAGNPARIIGKSCE